MAPGRGMKVVIENLGVCQKSWKVSVPAERVRAEYETMLDEICRGARVDGFRPGRAPRALVERRYRETVWKEVRERLMREAYRTAIREAVTLPLALLDAKAPLLNNLENGDWTVEFIVEMKPEFDLPPYKGLELSRRSIAVSDSDIDKAIRSLREDQARYADVTDRAAEVGDLVRIDFEAYLDGRPLEEAMPEARGLGKATDFWLRLGEDSPLPKFAEAHIGVRAGDTRSFEFVFPESFSFAPLRGRAVRYETRVKSVQRPHLPEMSLEWLKQWGVTTEDELRAQIRATLNEHQKLEEDNRLRTAALRAVVEKVNMDLPPLERDKTVRIWLADIVRRMAERGHPPDEIRSHSREISQMAIQNASDELRTRFVVEKIAEAEQIRIEEKEVDAEIAYLGSLQRENPDVLRKRLETSGGLDNVRQAILERKVVDFLVAHAKVRG